MVQGPFQTRRCGKSMPGNTLVAPSLPHAPLTSLSILTFLLQFMKWVQTTWICSQVILSLYLCSLDVFEVCMWFPWLWSMYSCISLENYRKIHVFGASWVWVVHVCNGWNRYSALTLTWMRIGMVTTSLLKILGTTLPETSSSPLKIGHPKKEISSYNY